MIEAAGRLGLASVFRCQDPYLVSFVAQATHIASWFKPEGPLTLDEIVAMYTKLPSGK